MARKHGRKHGRKNRHLGCACGTHGLAGLPGGGWKKGWLSSK